MKYCPHCHTSLDDHASVCPRCGFSWNEEPPTLPQTPPQNGQGYHSGFNRSAYDPNDERTTLNQEAGTSWQQNQNGHMHQQNQNGAIHQQQNMNRGSQQTAGYGHQIPPQYRNGQNGYNQAGYNQNVHGNNGYGQQGYGNGCQNGNGSGGYGGGYSNGGYNAGGPEKKGNGKKIAIWITVIVLILALAGGGAWYFLLRDPGESETADVLDQSSQNHTTISLDLGDSSKKDSSSEKKSEEKKSEESKSEEKKSEEKKSSEDFNVETAPQTSQKPAEPKKTEPETDDGTYVTQYVMKIRRGPNLSAEQVGRLNEGAVVHFRDYYNGSDGSRWGAISDDQWVCIYDSSMTYLRKQ